MLPSGRGFIPAVRLRLNSESEPWLPLNDAAAAPTVNWSGSTRSLRFKSFLVDYVRHPGGVPAIVSLYYIYQRLHCPACETSLEGSFAPGASPLQEAFTPEQLRSLLPFARLSQEQLYFLLTFVRCEGRFNRMEDEMGLSYPTLRNRLNDIIRAMGYEPSREEAVRPETPPVPASPSSAERQTILDMLSRGEINLDEAKRRLRGGE